jgi:hypothetical protein
MTLPLEAAAEAAAAAAVPEDPLENAAAAAAVPEEQLKPATAAADAAALEAASDVGFTSSLETRVTGA